MSVETSSDREAFLDDFGETVRFTLSGYGIETRAIVERPDVELDGQALEIGFRVPDASALLRAEVLGDFEIGDAFTVRTGPFAGEYIATDKVAEDDGAFVRLSLGVAA